MTLVAMLFKNRFNLRFEESLCLRFGRFCNDAGSADEEGKTNGGSRELEHGVDVE